MRLSQLSLERTRLSEEQIDRIVFGQMQDAPVKSDYIILLGHKPKYAEKRAAIAADHYFKYGDGKIIASGAALWEDGVSEAETMRKELLRLGVPDSSIVNESRATTTIENFTCALNEICILGGFKAGTSVTVVTEQFHLRRSLALAKALLPRCFAVCGYSSGNQKDEWKSKDVRLHGMVCNELRLLQELILLGCIEDIEF